MRLFLFFWAFLGLFLLGCSASKASKEVHPSFKCDQKDPSKVEKTICQDQELMLLDQKLQKVYQEASLSAKEEEGSVDYLNLHATQEGWVKGRDDCWKGKSVKSCVLYGYTSRISELQVTWNLVKKEENTLEFHCDSKKHPYLEVSFYKAQLPTILVEDGEHHYLAYLPNPKKPSKHYMGDQIQLELKAHEAVVIFDQAKVHPFSCLISGGD